MILSKEIAVTLNLSACKLKKYTAYVLKNNNVDLTPEQFLLLDLLWNMGSMSQQKLADTMEKDKNSITSLVDALEKKGLVKRRTDKNDRRSNLLILTPKAKEMKDPTKEKGISMLDAIIDGIPEEELRSMLATLNKLCDRMTQKDSQETDNE